MIDCLSLQVTPRTDEGWGTVSAAIKSFVNAASADDTVGAFAGRMPSVDIHQTSRAQLRARLKPHVSRAVAAAKMMELPPAASNPARVSRWLETSSPHVCLVFSPLKERGPPRP